MVWSVDFDSGAGSGDTPDGGGTSGGGTGSGGNETGSGIVEVDSNIWSSQNPQVQCEPPCVLVLPPIPLPEPSTMSFPPFTTSYIVQTTEVTNGQTVTTSKTVQTVINIPPVTTTEIEVWGVTVFSQDTTPATFTAVQSITPLSFVVTLPGSAYFPVFATPTIDPSVSTSSSSSSTIVPFFPSSHLITIQPQPTVSITTTPGPSITYSSGKPTSTCKSHCGHHGCQTFGCGGGCKLFGCGSGCGLFGCGGGGCGLLGCGGGCGIFGCDGGCGLKGCGSSNCPDCGPGPGGDTQNGSDNQDNQDDDEEEVCKLQQAGICDGSGDNGSGSDGSGGNGSGGMTNGDVKTITGYTPAQGEVQTTSTTTLPLPAPSTVTTVVIVTAAPAPTPSPSPDPSPPSPDPSTEKKRCYDSGSWVNRYDAINAVDSFCNKPQDADPAFNNFPHYGGYTVKNNQYIEYQQPASLTSGWPVNIVISIQALNGCEWTIDGPAPDQECGRILRRILDECDTVSGTARKQGGTLTNNCAVWRFDPGFNGDALINDLCDATPALKAVCAAAG